MKPNKKEIAEELIRKFPETSSLSLARKIYNENFPLFQNVEDARRTIRSVRKASGYKQRKSGSQELADIYTGAKVRYNLPATWAPQKETFHIPSGFKNIGIVSDAQVPFHDETALKIAVQFLKDQKIDCLLINGDWVDFYGLSYFQKDPRARHFGEEKEQVIESLGWLRQQFSCPIYYNLDANHERRFERFWMQRAPELADEEFTSLDEFLFLPKLKIIPIKDYYKIMIGKLNVLHGDTLFRGTQSPASAARTVWMKVKKSCIASHCHWPNSYSDKNIDEEISVCWTTGCLMNLHVSYNKHGNKYMHGFARVEMLNGGNFRVHNYLIDQNQVYHL